MVLSLKEFACKRNSIYKFQNFAIEKTVKGCGFQWKYLRYQAAVAAIEQYGWQAIHGDAQAQICTFFSKKLREDHEMTIHLIKCHITGMGGWTPRFLLVYHISDSHPFADSSKKTSDAPFEEWTALHWSAVEGNLEVCHRLLIALANPLQVDQAGGYCEVMLEVDSGLAADGNDGNETCRKVLLGLCAWSRKCQDLRFGIAVSGECKATSLMVEIDVYCRNSKSA